MVALVQTASFANTFTGLTFSSPTTAGNTIVVAVALQGNVSAPAASVTGVTLGGVADNFASQISTTQGQQAFAIWADPNCAGGQTTIAVTYANSPANGAVFIYEFSGVGTSGAQVTSATGATSSVSVGPVSLSATGAYVAMYANRGGTNTSATPGSPWTNATTQPSYAAEGGYAVTSGSRSYNATLASSSNWGGVIVALAQPIVTGSVSGTVTTSSTATANASSPGAVSGTVGTTSTVTANVTSPATVLGLVDTTQTVVTTVGQVTGTVATTSTVTANVSSPGQVTGTVATTGTVAGAVLGTVTGTVDTTGAATANVTSPGVVSGTVSTTGTVVAQGIPPTPPTYPPGVAPSSNQLRWWSFARPLAAATGGSVSAATGSWTTVGTSTVGVDRAGGFTTPRYTFGVYLGLYAVSGQVTFAGSTGGAARQARIQLNGQNLPGAAAEIPRPSTATSATVVVPPTTIVATSTYDLLTLQAWQDSGSPLTVTSAQIKVEYLGAAGGALNAPVAALQGPQPASGSPVETPGVPAFTTVSSTSYMPTDGGTRASITASWTQPLNADGTLDVTGDHYEVQYRPTGTTEWQSQTVAWDATQATILDLNLVTSYDLQIRAVNRGSVVSTSTAPTKTGVRYRAFSASTQPSVTSVSVTDSTVPGSWSATTTQVTAGDVTAPGQPSTPTVAASLIAVQVTHDLTLAAGGSLPADMDHLEVHLGTSSGFTPGLSTLAGKLVANWGMIQAGISAVGTFKTGNTSTTWVKVIAVDRSGNRSAASVGASGTATLLDDAHISDLTVTKVTAGTISATWLMGGLIRTAASGARWEMDSTSIRAYNSAGTNTVSFTAAGALTATGNFSFATAASGASVTITSGSSDRITFTSPNGTASYINSVDSSVGAKITMMAANGANVYAGRGSTGEIVSALATGGINYVSVDNINGAVISGPGQVTGNFSANGNLNVLGSTTLGATSTGALSPSSLTVSGTTTLNGSPSLYGTTCTINPSGNVNVTATNAVLTATGNVTLDGASILLGANTSTTDQVYAYAVYNFSSASAGATVNLETSSTNRLYRYTSSAAYKVDIRDAPDLTASVLGLRPVTYWDKAQYEGADDPESLVRWLGLVAEEVDADPALGPWMVHHEPDGSPVGVDYAKVGLLLVPVVRDLAARVAAIEATRS